MDPTLVVFASFIVFLGIAYRLGYRRSIAALDHKIEAIRQALEEAAQGKEAAVQALNEERRRHGQVHEEVKLISKRAEEQALILRQQALQEMDKIISDRQKATKDMVERMHGAAVQAIQKEAAELTLAAFEDLVRNRFSDAQQEALNQEAVMRIVGQLEKDQKAPAPNVSHPRRARAGRVGKG